MIRHLLLTSEVETNLEELVLEKTEGIPFFIEEFIKSLKDLSIIEKKNDVYRLKKDVAEIAIPATIQDVIMARVDSLPEAAKTLLQIGSVVGREFSHKLITQVTGMSEQELLSNISISKDSELLYERGVYPQSTYVFKHALTRDVIYDSILATRKNRLHVEIGRGIEKVHVGDLDDYYAELFEHLSCSTDVADLKRAVDYGKRAASRALAVYAYGEAVTLTERVLKLQEVIDPEDKVQKCDLLLQLGETRLLAGEPRHILDFEAPEALSLAKATNNDTLASRACLLATWALGYHSGTLALGSSEAIHWAESADRYAKPNTIERAWADMNLGTVRCTTGDLVSGVHLLGNAIDLARKLGDLETFWRAAYNWLFYVSAPQHVDDRLKLAIELTKCSRVGVSIVPLAGALPMMSDAFMVQGQRDRAEEFINEIRDLAQESGQLYFQLVAMALDAIVATWDGQLEDAVEMIKRTRAQGDELGLSEFTYVVAIICGLRSYLHLGKYDEALRLVEMQQLITVPARCLCLAHIGRHTEVTEMLEQLVLPRQGLGFDVDETPAWVDVLLLEAAVLVGHREAASLLAARFANSNYLTTGAFYPTCVRRHLGTAAALLDRPNYALSTLNSALLDARKVGFRPEIALIRLELAKLLFEHYPEQRVNAKEHLQFAVTEFQTMKMQGALDHASRYMD
jgi:hypothetical protein